MVSRYMFLTYINDQFFSEHIFIVIIAFLMRKVNIQENTEYRNRDKMAKKDESQPQNRQELEEIFEKTLRPLQSKNARHIYVVLRDAKTDYLTTYDIQPILQEQGNKLSKVELNNWLSALQEAGLVQKAPEWGKPTTRPYNRRYTFDLWKLSQKGRETAQLLRVFSGNTPIQIIEKVVEKTIEKPVEAPRFPELVDMSFGDLKKIQSLSINLGLLKSLSRRDPMDITSLSDETGYTSERIVEFIESQEKFGSNTLYFLSEIPMDLRGKILQTIGLNPKKNYSVSLSSEGKKILSVLSSWFYLQHLDEYFMALGLSENHVKILDRVCVQNVEGTFTIRPKTSDLKIYMFNATTMCHTAIF